MKDQIPKNKNSSFQGPTRRLSQRQNHKCIPATLYEKANNLTMNSYQNKI